MRKGGCPASQHLQAASLPTDLAGTFATRPEGRKANLPACCCDALQYHHTLATEHRALETYGEVEALVDHKGIEISSEPG
jgi:hypothetical protein